MYGRDLEVIYLLSHGWCVREEGTKNLIYEKMPNQSQAISAAAAEGQNRVDEEEWRTVEVRIKSKWMKRIVDTRTYGYDPPSKG